MKSTKKKIFVITGAGAGFGRAFAEAALKAEHTVVGTVRRQGNRPEPSRNSPIEYQLLKDRT